MHSRFWSLSLALSLAALGALPAARAAVQPRRKPNLLFLHTDQQRQDTLRAYGNTAILYTTYEMDLQVGGKPSTERGAATEVFVRRDGAWINTGWQLASAGK